MGGYRSRVLLTVALAVSILSASCSVSEGVFDDEAAEQTTNSALNSDAAEENPTGSKDSQLVEEGVETARPSIWTRSDDAAIRPAGPTSSLKDSVAPGADRGWTIVGSIFDYETNTSQPASWEADKLQTSNGWTRVAIPAASGDSASMSALARTDSFDVAVGSHGRDRDLRPAVWLRSEGEQWRSVARPQFDSGTREWLDLVAISSPSDAILAVGGRIDSDNRHNPTIWTSTDGERWEAVSGLPFATDGSERILGLASGPELSIITGRRQNESKQTAIAFWSEDGASWREAQVELPEDADNSNFGEVTWFADRFVVVGGVAFDGVFQPAAWTSTDGRSWELQDVRFGLNEDGRSATSGLEALRVTATDTQLYATASSSFLQHLWTSSDGTNWTAVDNIWDIRDQGVGITSLAADEAQVLLPTSEPSVMFHEAGRGFRERPLNRDLLPFPSEVPYVTDVAHTADGWIAVGGASVRVTGGGTTGKAFLWESPDASSWTSIDGISEASTGTMSAVDTSATGTAIVGTETLRSEANRDAPGRGFIWQSSDSAWAESDPIELSSPSQRVNLHAVAMAGGDLIVGGWVHGGDHVDALLSDAASADLPQEIDIGHRGPDNEKIAVLCGAETGEAVAFVHIDKKIGGQRSVPLSRTAQGQWTEAEVVESGFDSLRHTVTDCAFGVDGFLAAGWTGIDTDEDVGLWRSANGTSWEKVDGPPSFSTPADQWVNSMVTTEGGYLLAGMDASSGQTIPVVWFGSGNDWQQIVVGVDTEGMTGLKVGFADGTIVVIGRKNGAERVYTTTLDQLTTELGR